ncbi:MAG: hypothetical protein GX558_06805 [Clostridiales bacterium]|nr:hypothetical protein [Clostridiales bacterium]
MASQYYGLKGNLVKKYQKMLNSLGANLKVDGVWGKLTESAYNRYMDSFQNLLNPQPEEEEAPLARIDFAPRTDEELRSQAENRYGSLYEADIAAAQSSAAAGQAALTRLIDALEPALRAQLADLAARYAAARQSLSDQALSRGLGRSSYLIDQLSGSQISELDAGQQLQRQAQSRETELQDQIGALLSDLNATTSRLTGERERAIASAIDAYRQDDQNSALEALKYNNQLTQAERDRAEEIRQFEQELKVKKAKLK